MDEHFDVIVRPLNIDTDKIVLSITNNSILRQFITVNEKELIQLLEAITDYLED